MKILSEKKKGQTAYKTPKIKIALRRKKRLIQLN